MTDSFFSSIGKASFAPPDISNTNYMQTEADMVESVNNEIDRIYREGFSQIDTQSLGDVSSEGLGANQ